MSASSSGSGSADDQPARRADREVLVTDPSAIAAETAHRPWPMPASPWVLSQTWSDLLFAHWRVPSERLRRLVPPELDLDLFDGDAWLGITPFRVENFRTRGLPIPPGVSAFPELNLRTYVRASGKPGIHFFSLDAGSGVAVAGARTVFRLPYHRAEMDVRSADGRVEFASRRRSGEARFRASYEPRGRAFEAEPGTLEHFLTARYALFVVLRGGGLLETEIHHRPWRLQAAEAEIVENGVAGAAGLVLPATEPDLLHFSSRQESLIWAPSLARG